MKTYYKILAETTDSDAGEIVASCQASRARDARRILGVDGSNAHLYEVTLRPYDNAHDPDGRAAN